MSFIADLHIHSRYSRAVSKDMAPETLHRWAQLKGITVVGTGDFTHPGWFAELREKLEPAESGLFRLKPALAASVNAGIPASCRAEVRFMLTSEISSIYKRHARTRKVHNLIFAPGFSAVASLTERLARVGNLHSDGRPILGLDSEELLRMMLARAPESLFVPAHAWTPHFSVFGSNSGFDSLEECFGDMTPHVRVLETGLSSDPPMNRRLSRLDGITLISNSDAHSPAKLGREANVLNGDLSFSGITQAFASGDPGVFLGTIEFFPEEGKYHYDGHRACRVRLSPDESRRRNNVCPECGKPVTRGVMHRVDALADQPVGRRFSGALPYWNLVPLAELIAEVNGVGVAAKTVTESYHGLLAGLGNEFKILMDVPVPDLEHHGGRLLAEAIRRMREGKVTIAPGYDGEYGTVRVLSEDDCRSHAAQRSLF